MALQTKTFSWGSFNWNSESNAYKLELTLTENSVDQVNNRSNISYKLVLKSGSNNRFNGQIDSVLKLNGVQAATGSKQISAAYNASWVLLEGTTNVTHNQDGKLDMPVVVSINTYNTSAPPDKTLNWSWALTTIPRASQITGATKVTLGNACRISWVPNSTAFGYKLRFYVEKDGKKVWETITDPIHPGKTTANTYNQTVLPLELAQYITDSDTGIVKVVLTTYAESTCKTYIGEDDASFYVVVPQNESTLPIITRAEILQVKGFDDLYLQNRSQVQGVIEATGQFGATVTATMTVQGKTYRSPWLSDPVTESGKVLLTATDSRGFAVSREFDITVTAYVRPALKATAARCKADGTPDDAGEHLRIDATVDFASVEGKNSATLLYCYRAENASGFTEPVQIDKTVESGVMVTSGALMNGTLRKDTAYVIQVIAQDAAGEKTDNTLRIASENVYLDKPAGGDRIGVGGYCDGPGVTVHWDVKVKKDVSVDGTLQVGNSLRVGGQAAAHLNGVYMAKTYVSGTNQFQMQTSIGGESAMSRQSLFLFGFDNNQLVRGVIGARSDGTASWDGTEGVSVSINAQGVVTVTLPHNAYDRFVAISGDEFKFV